MAYTKNFFNYKIMVESVSDGIINILGLENAANGEMVEIFIDSYIESNVVKIEKALILNLGEKSINKVDNKINLGFKIFKRQYHSNLNLYLRIKIIYLNCDIQTLNSLFPANKWKNTYYYANLPQYQKLKDGNERWIRKFFELNLITKNQYELYIYNNNNISLVWEHALCHFNFNNILGSIPITSKKSSIWSLIEKKYINENYKFKDAYRSKIEQFKISEGVYIQSQGLGINMDNNPNVYIRSLLNKEVLEESGSLIPRVYNIENLVEIANLVDSGEIFSIVLVDNHFYLVEDLIESYEINRLKDLVENKPENNVFLEKLIKTSSRFNNTNKAREPILVNKSFQDHFSFKNSGGEL